MTVLARQTASSSDSATQVRASLRWGDGAAPVRKDLEDPSLPIRAEILRNRPLTVQSMQVSGLSGVSGEVVYKTAALPAELHRRETLNIVANPLTGPRKPTFHLRILP
jgi:hypothetical protein